MQKGPNRFGSKFQEILILLPNLNVSKRPYPCHALGRSACLGQGCLGLSQPAPGPKPAPSPAQDPAPTLCAKKNGSSYSVSIFFSVAG